MTSPGHDITILLRELGAGRDGAMDRLLPLVYDELRKLAHHHRYAWGSAQAPGTKSLVHEAYLKLADQDVDWQCRGQFFAIASRAMRSILVDNARRWSRQKREGQRRQVPLTDDVLVSESRADELLELDAALDRLKDADAHMAQVVECRVFGGLTVEETGDALGLSPATVKRRWSLARAWLYQELTKSSRVLDGSGPP